MTKISMEGWTDEEKEFYKQFDEAYENLVGYWIQNNCKPEISIEKLIEVADKEGVSIKDIWEKK